MSVLDRLLGRPLASSEEDSEKIGVLAGVPSLGLDGLSSAAYGPEAALSILIPVGILGLSYILPISGLILLLLGILYLSYRQTIGAYPNGGGSYTVARENLGVNFGLLAAAALMVDYTLNVAVGISAGVGALISMIPSLHHHMLALCMLTLAVLTIGNLRGVREAGLLFSIPTYLFIGTLLIVVAVGIYRVVAGHGTPEAIVPPPAVPAATIRTAGIWLLLKAFASGCTAMTGVEAVSNGVTMFANPRVKKAEMTLTVIVGSLAVLLAGIAYLSKAYGIAAMDENASNYQSILSQLTFAATGRGWFYYVTMGSVIVVLALSANTSYAGFPRLCRLLAIDEYLPRSFRLLGRRLVYTVGVAFLTGLAGVLLYVFHGVTDNLIPLFAVGAFLAFTMSQAGMVVHWKRKIAEEKEGNKQAFLPSMIINGIGAVSTSLALIVILAAKFADGAWVTVLIMPVLLVVFGMVKHHYKRVANAIAYPKPLDVSNIGQPYVIVPIEKWNVVVQRSIRFALRISNNVDVLHVDVQEDAPPDEDLQESEHATALRGCWEKFVVAPTKEAGVTTPNLVVIPSPYRRISGPIIDYIKTVQAKDPSRIVTVIIPELVQRRWWDVVLHNHRAAALKAALLIQGDGHTVVVNVPWYLD